MDLPKAVKGHATSIQSEVAKFKPRNDAYIARISPSIQAVRELHALFLRLKMKTLAKFRNMKSLEPYKLFADDL